MSKKSQQERAERAAAALKAQQARERRRSRLTVLAVVVAILVIVGGGFAANRLRSGDNAVSAAPAGASGEFGLTIGDKTAPHSIVIYEDFLCPFCGELEKASHEKLAELAADGKVYVDYRPFNLLDTDYSVAAASAFKVVLDAAGPDVAKKFHDELYADQPSESGPFPDADWFVQKAVDAGATEADVKQGIEDESQQDWVTDATKAASKAGVSSTPTILLDGKLYQDGRTIDDLTSNLIDAVS